MNLQKSMYSDSSDSFRNKTLQQYKNDYFDVLDYYKKLNEDNDEINFVNTELRLIKEYIRPALENEITELEKKHGLDLEIHMIRRNLASYIKIIEFLETRKSEFGASLKDFATDEKTLKWRATDLQFTELAKSLYELKIISPELTQKEFFKRMRQVFSLEEFNESDKIKEITNRKNTSATFLNLLEGALNDYISRQIGKRKR